jgi:hypothetical protein
VLVQILYLRLESIKSRHPKIKRVYDIKKGKTTLRGKGAMADF